ncbi:MAG: amino acid transporter [Planctomycetaceae bacterium]|nr:amino acid transporter [Planctomycetaceae bacterium]
MLSTSQRPRQLHWYHAVPMLFGDWGTSRLYVLGLCFFYTQHASLWFMLAMSVLLVAVGWAYSVVCRLYPDGGGVYSSAKHRSQTLAVIGALLLGADYVVTAALSALDAFHYLNVPIPGVWAALSIFLLGVMNYFGPTKAGLAALVAALLTIIFSMTVGVAAAPYLSWANVTAPTGSPMGWWTQFTAIILAISGVEAVANMTGIMVEPVAKTARRAIWPVLAEIVILNLVLTMAMLAVPPEVLGDGDASLAYSLHRDDMLRVLASYYVGPSFAAVASVVFALLLLSAVNTAISDLVSIQYMMARDRELPGPFAGLNFWGMPVLPLLIGTAIPLILVLIVPDVGHLADLYAIGVVGAVAVNLGSCVTTPGLALRIWERIVMGLLAVLMIAIWISIAFEKPHALIFAGTIVLLGLTARLLAHHRTAIGVRVQTLMTQLHDLTIVDQQEVATAHVHARTRFMVATQGNSKLTNYAIGEAKIHNAELLILFVRHVAVVTMGAVKQPSLEEDVAAQEMFSGIRAQALAAGVHVRFLYATADSIADTIVDFAVTMGVERLFMGASQRGNLWRVMKGDVIQGVAQQLPERTLLLIQA